MSAEMTETEAQQAMLLLMLGDVEGKVLEELDALCAEASEALPQTLALTHRCTNMENVIDERIRTARDTSCDEFLRAHGRKVRALLRMQR